MSSFLKITFKLIIFLGAFPLKAYSYGDYQNTRDYLWVPQSTEVLTITSTPLTDNVYQSTVTISPINRGVNSKISDLFCEQGPAGTYWENNNKRFGRFWLMYSTSGNTNGIDWDFTLNNGAIKGPFPASQTGGPVDYEVIALSESTINEVWRETCLPLGTQHNPVQFSGSSVSGSLTLQQASLPPGNYKIKIPLKWGFEEAKYYVGTVLATGENYKAPDLNSTGLITRIGSSLSNGGVLVNANIDVLITSKCNLDQHKIAIEHGQISLDSSKDFYDAEATATLTCDSGGGAPSVSLELIGKDPVIGQTTNFTQCGSSGTGSCELTYDIDTLKDKFNEKITLSGAHQITFRSKYRPGQHPTAGAFEGNALLKLNIN